MRALYEAKLIQIEVTNRCWLQCANCTRFVGHHKNPFTMDLETVEKALQSLEGFPGNVGLMGGDPTMHPQFAEICALYQKYFPDKNRRQLWTSGFKWEEYKDIIKETFPTENILYNDHSEEDEGFHQPLLISADEIMEDKELMWKLISECWIQKRWSPSITPKGCFFCEVAAAADMLFDGPGGWPIEKGWWKKDPKDFQDQVDRYCKDCSAAIPLEIPSNHEKFDLISPRNLERLKSVNSPKAKKGNYRVYDKPYTYDDYLKFVKTWAPGQYRDFFQSEPDQKNPHTQRKDKVCGDCNNSGCLPQKPSSDK